MILDLSWPTGRSINDAIPDRVYLSQLYSLVYPTIDTIAECVALVGRSCLLFKRDLKRAYHQFPINPFDYPLLGYQWNSELYFDVVLPMGLKTATMVCQRSTSAVSYALTGRMFCGQLPRFYRHFFARQSLPWLRYLWFAFTWFTNLRRLVRHLRYFFGWVSKSTLLL